MDVQATAKYLPISPQKARLVCDQIRGMNPYEASMLLEHLPQKGAAMLLKVVNSAISNAENNFELDPDTMVIAEVYANEGPRRPWRRYGARGRFKPIIRRTSHLTVILSESSAAFEDKGDTVSEVEVEEEEG